MAPYIPSTEKQTRIIRSVSNKALQRQYFCILFKKA